MRKVLSIFCLLLISATASAGEWMKVAEGTTSDFYLSSSRIKNKGSIFQDGNDIIEIWVKSIYTHSKSPKTPIGTFSLIRYQFTCPAETYNMYEVAVYNKNGKIIDSSTTPNYNVRIMPDTVIEYVISVACEVVNSRK